MEQLADEEEVVRELWRKLVGALEEAATAGEARPGLLEGLLPA